MYIHEKSNLSFSKNKKQISKTHGNGLYAIDDIKEGEVVAVKGGYIMSRDEWAKLEPSVGEAAEIQISDELVIAPRNKEEFDGCMMALNHSCEPNVGVQGDITYVAMRDISNGEQLNLDYAMIDDFDGQMKCLCGVKNCRKVIYGRDWKKQDLQEKYKGYFATFIQKKINRL